MVNIQAAIDTAMDGDIIDVLPGEYFENIDTRGKKVRLFASSGPSLTTLNGSTQLASVIVCSSGETNETVIEGFTITGGRGSLIEGSSSRIGGGIFCRNASPIIRNIVITRNSVSPTSSTGGGLSIGGAAIIENNTIENNYAEVNAGGAYISSSSPCIFIGNKVLNNEAGRGDGGGVDIFGGAIVENNLFRGNLAGDHGGALYISSLRVTPSNIVVKGNVVVDNCALSTAASNCAGGAIWIEGGGEIRNNTIAFNHAQGGMYRPVGGFVSCLADPAL